MKKTVFQMNEEERKRAVEVIGNTVLMLEEGRSIKYISEKLDLTPYKVLENIYENLYVIRRYIGRWEYFKQLFVK